MEVSRSDAGVGMYNGESVPAYDWNDVITVVSLVAGTRPELKYGFKFHPQTKISLPGLVRYLMRFPSTDAILGGTSKSPGSSNSQRYVTQLSVRTKAATRKVRRPSNRRSGRNFKFVSEPARHSSLE